MGTLYTFYMFDGSSESVRDGGLGATWVRDWALNNIPVNEVWQVSALNFICSGVEFFN